MNFKILGILLLLIAGNVNARQVITGKLTDKETSTPIEAASVELLLLPDSTSVEAIITNTEGSFMLYKADTAKVYCLRIKHVSYKPYVVQVPKKVGSMINSVGNIAMEPSLYNIKEVVVAGSKVRVTELPDRTIYGIPLDMKKASTDGLDVLRKVPSVQVDYLNENITVEGKTNIKLEVDGVTRDKDYLKKLHPSQVDKMEIITSPSGKYDAEVDAVVNIITIKEMRYGLKGSVNTQLLPNSKDTYMGGAMGNLDYGLKKISYYVSANGGVQKFNFYNNMYRDAVGEIIDREGFQKSKNMGGSVSGGLTYDPDEYNNLNFSVRYNGNSNDGDGYNSNTSKKSSDVLGITDTTYNNSHNVNTGINAMLFYKHKFDKKTQHGYEIETNYFHSLKGISESDFRTNYYGTEQNELNRTNRESFSIQANYTLPFDSVYTFNTGISGRYEGFDVENLRSSISIPGLDYSDLRGSVFAELSRTFKNGNIKVGTRIEAAHVTINKGNKNDYFSPLPYASGQYKIGSRNSIKLNYSRRVIRPTSAQLNPFESFVDSFTVSKGNIKLTPAYRDNFQLTYSMKYGKSKFSGNISPQVFYEKQTRLIQSIIQPRENTSRFEKVYQNINNGYNTGIGISLNAQIFMVMLNSNFRYSKYHIDSYGNEIDVKNGKTWNWNSYVMSPLPKNFKIFAVLNMTGPTINGQETSKMSPFYLLGVVKQFKNNSSLNVFVLNPFTDKFFQNKTKIQNTYLYQHSETYLGLKRAIMFTYSYSFKIGKNINSQKRNSEQNGDENGGGFKLPF